MDLIKGVESKVLKYNMDDRGGLMEIVRNDDSFFEKFGQTYISNTRPCVVKAFHMHKIQTDLFVCLKGEIRLVLFNTEGEINEFFMGERNPLLVKIPPNIYHGWKCISAEESMVLNVCSEVYNYDKPDEYRVRPHGYVTGFTWDTIDR